MQKSLRIASSCIDELTSVQLYVDALDRYVYYFEQGVEAVTPKYINSLVELILGNIDNIQQISPNDQMGGASGGGGRRGNVGEGLIDGVGSSEMVIRVSSSTTIFSSWPISRDEQDVQGLFIDDI